MACHGVAVAQVRVGAPLGALGASRKPDEMWFIIMSNIKNDLLKMAVVFFFPVWTEPYLVVRFKYPFDLDDDLMVNSLLDPIVV